MATASSSSVPDQDPEPELQLQPSPSNTHTSKPLQAISPPKKTPPLPWSHIETVHLIQAYQEKWYSLKRGQLKASQWEEVAVTVAARCRYDEPSKTSTQCRHKIEKLRKRYRTEKQRLYPNSWQYFDLMDQMERGPLPISARPMAMVKYQNSDDEDEDEDEDDAFDDKKYKSKSVNHIVKGPLIFNKSVMDRKSSDYSGGGGVDGVSRFLRNPMFRKPRKSFEIDDDDGNDNDNDNDNHNDDDDDDDDDNVDEEVEGDGVGGGGKGVLLGLASEMRAFAERFVSMENMKMEMMRETEKDRMEMENKRMEMIVESQRKVVDTIARAFGSHKKLKMAQEF